MLLCLNILIDQLRRMQQSMQQHTNQKISLRSVLENVIKRRSITSA
jgi:hypothetical protein